MSATCHILIVEDHQLLLTGLKSLLAEEAHLEVIGEAHSVADAIAFVEQTVPDLAIVDLSLVDSRGIEFVHHLAEHHPSVRILVFSQRPAWVMGDRVIAVGAHGYLRKSPQDMQIVEAINALMRGETYVSEGQPGPHAKSKEYLPAIKSLSNQEFLVFELTGQGLRNAEIAKEIGGSPNSVRSVLDRIKHKLDLSTAEELKRVALAWQFDTLL